MCIKNIKLLLKVFLCLVFAFPNPALASQKQQVFVSSVTINQSKYENNGVFVSKPDPEDERIVHIIKRNNLRNVEDYVAWLKDNVRYRNDPHGDTWSSPESTVLRRSGDCEDYAFLSQAVLRKVGYTPKVLAIGGLEGGHAICVFVEDGYYCWIDNNELKKTKARSVLEFAQHLFLNYNCCYLLKVSKKDNDWEILFKKSEIVNKMM